MGVALGVVLREQSIHFDESSFLEGIQSNYNISVKHPKKHIFLFLIYNILYNTIEKGKLVFHLCSVWGVLIIYGIE